MKHVTMTSVLLLFFAGCDGSSAVELERTILACNAGQENDIEKCKAAERAQAENIETLVNRFFK